VILAQRTFVDRQEPVPIRTSDAQERIPTEPWTGRSASYREEQAGTLSSNELTNSR